MFNLSYLIIFQKLHHYISVIQLSCPIRANDPTLTLREDYCPHLYFFEVSENENVKIVMLFISVYISFSHLTFNVLKYDWYF